MKIVLVGCGNVGFAIAQRLSLEGHDITVIDIDERAVKDTSQSLDVMGIVGNGVSLDSLKEADVKSCDILIAVTESDERNLLICLLGRKLGNCNTIARVRNPEYFDETEYLKDELGLSLTVNPELAASNEIARLIKFPSAIEIDSFAKGRVELLKIEVIPGSSLDGMVLKKMNSSLNCDVLVCIVERGNETFIPDGNFVLKNGDRISFIARAKNAVAFLKAMNMSTGKARTAMIVGGGETTQYLTKVLINSGVAVKIIERDSKRCEELSETFPEATVICGDGGNKDVLHEEGIERTQCFVGLSNHDEENVMMAIYARKVNPSIKLITKIHRGSYDDIVKELNLGSIINPKLISADNVVKYVRAKQNGFKSGVESLYKLCDGNAEALEFAVRNNSDIIGKPLMELSLKTNVLIACIIHNGQIETPKGSSVINEGDTVVVVTTRTGFTDISDILEK